MQAGAAIAITFCKKFLFHTAIYPKNPKVNPMNDIIKKEFPLKQLIKIGKIGDNGEVVVKALGEIYEITEDTFLISTLPDRLARPSTIGAMPYGESYCIAVNHVGTDWYRVPSIRDISMNRSVSKYQFGMPTSSTPYQMPPIESQEDTEESE